jgi:hypothetical protein
MGTRYDLVLLAMIDQASSTWPIRTRRFFMHGFSCGGQFAHRFTYLHPGRLLGVSIGAPGKITLPADAHAWLAGGRGGRASLASNIEWAALARVSTHLVVGEDDTAVLGASSDDKNSTDEPRTRMGNVLALSAAWQASGIQCRVDVVPGVGHAGLKCLQPVFAFLDPLVAAEKMSRDR